MNIALLTDGIHPFIIGGMQKHSYYIAKYLARLGHKITVFHCVMQETDVNYSDIFTEKELTNLTFILVKFPTKDTKIGHYIRNSKLYSQALYVEFKKHSEFDFVYTKGFTGYYLIKNKENIRAPIAVQLHGLEMFQKGGSLKQWAEKWILKKPATYCLKNADFVFSYGGKILPILYKLNIPKATIVKQQGAADDFWLQAVNNERNFADTFTFVGRYEHRKGLHLLHAILKNLPSNVVFNIVGAVPKKHQSSQKNICYLGNKTANELFHLLKNTTFLLAPSLSEGFPTIIVEAMAQGVIPVVTDVGAISEIVNVENGITFKPNSTQALKETIIYALSLPTNNRRILSANASEKVKQDFNWENASIKLANDIQTICDNWKRTNSKNFK